MTPDEFRRLALKMQGAIEGAHMGHPDFRANGRIFATLYPDNKRGMVQLKPDQQADFIRIDSGAFTPASGAWGRQGSTIVLLALVDEDTLGEAMTLAWQNTVKAASTSKTQARRQTVEATAATPSALISNAKSVALTLYASSVIKISSRLLMV